MSWSTVMILPAELQAAGNLLAIALGHDGSGPPGRTFTLPLAPAESEAPTHYGCEATATDGFKSIIEAAQLGVYPDGIDPELAAPVVAALIVSFQSAGEIDASAHFDSVAAANGLTRFVEAEA